MPWGKQGLTARSKGAAVVAKCVGLYGFNAGPGVHIVDPLAIADGFLSRLPSKSRLILATTNGVACRGYVQTIGSRQELVARPGAGRALRSDAIAPAGTAVGAGALAGDLGDEHGR